MTLNITPFKCPFCIGGLVDVDERCMHCSGSGLTDQPCGEAERAPRPPAVMRTPCADCAYRPGSPEREALGVQLPLEEPFYCHQGLPVSASGAYTPVATFRGLPLGAMVCAGWWAQQTGEELPVKPYREIPIGEDEVDKRWGTAPYALRQAQLCGVVGEGIHGPTAPCSKSASHHPADPWHGDGSGLTWADVTVNEPTGPDT